MDAARPVCTTERRDTVNYTHYDYLEIAPSAPVAAVDASYARILERLGYGSCSDGADHSALLRKIHAAYEVLSDPVARKSYDTRLAQEAAMADAELKAALDIQAVRPRRVQDVP